MPSPLRDLVNRHAPWLLFAGVLAGLLAPSLAALAWPLVLPVTFGLFTLPLLRMDLDEALRHARKPARTALIVALLMVGAPLLTALASKIIPMPPGMALALIMTATTTPIVSSPAFALLLGLEVELALVVVLGTIVAVPITMPALALALLGLEIGMGPFELMFRLVAFVGLGLAVAAAARWQFGAAQLKAQAANFDFWNVILLTVFAIGVMHGVMDRLVADPLHVAMFVVAAFLMNLLWQAAGAVAFAPAGKREALTVGLMFGYRNMALLLAVLPDAAPADLVLFIGVAQLPMYTLPVLSAPAYRRLLAP